MEKCKRATAVFLAVLSILAMDNAIVPTSRNDNSFIMTASAEDIDITWNLDDNGVLTISGSTAMAITNNETSVAWHTSRNLIKEVVIQDGVKSIGRYAFANCKNLTKISIPSSVTEIGQSAFANDTLLTSITIPSNVKVVESRAFSNTGCTEIVFPDSVKTLDGAVMADSTLLEKVVLSEGLTTLGENLFGNCENLKSVNIPSTVTDIENYAFSGCSSLTSLTLPEGLKTISYNAFELCSGLKNIVIPESVETIGDCAFQFCTALESIQITNADIELGQGVFSECANLVTADIPEELTFPSNLFMHDTKLTGVSQSYDIAGGTEGGQSTNDRVNWKLSSDGVLTISGNCRMREEEQTASFTTAWGKSGEYRSLIKKIVIEEGIKSTAVRGFEYLPNLEEVVLPSTVDKICLNSFAHCPKLKTINFPEGLTSIGNYAFYGAESLQTIDLPSTLETLGIASFYCCYPVETITVPEKVKSIPHDCFAGCNNLKNLTLSEGLENIGFQAFFACGFEEVTIPDSVETLEENAFIDCHNLQYVHFSENSKLTSIGSAAFDNCFALKSFAMPDSVTELKSAVFSQCFNLSEVKLSKNITTIETSAFTSCVGLTKLYIPTSLKTVEKFAFQNMDNLNTIIYCGTPEQWDAINVGEGNDIFAEYPQFHEYDHDKCNYCGAEREYSNSRFEGYSLTLDGSIGVNLYMSLDSCVTADADAYLRFILPDNSVQKVLVSEADRKTVDNKEYYVFRCNVSAQNMFDPITAQIALGDSSKIDTIQFTVDEYASALRKRDDRYADFVEKFLDYGRFSRCYFNQTVDYPKEYTEDDYARVLKNITPSKGIEDADYIGSSLLLKTNTILRHYFKSNATGRKAKYSLNGGETVYYVEQSLAPTQYDQKIDGLEYCIYDYIYRMISSDTADESMKKLCVALYDYADACKELAAKDLL